MAALRLAHPACDLVLCTVAVCLGLAAFTASSRVLLALIGGGAVVALKLRLAHADRLRRDGLRREGVGSKLNQLLAVSVVSASVTGLVTLSLR